jgi:hypothetical protein
MRRNIATLFGTALAALPMLALAAEAQPAPSTRKVAATPPPSLGSAPNCPGPAESKDAKVIDIDHTKAVARLAVNLGAGRFKVVTIKTWDHPDDPRPAVPVIEAARIMQGKLQFYTPQLDPNPESAPETFLLMAEMGGEHVCWATPSSLISDASHTATTKTKVGPTTVSAGAQAPVQEGVQPAVGRASGNAVVRRQAKPQVTPVLAGVSAHLRARARVQATATANESAASATNASAANAQAERSWIEMFNRAAR